MSGKTIAACVPQRVLWLALTDALVITATLSASVWMAARTRAAGGDATAAWNVVIVSGVLLLCLHYYDLYEFRITASLLQVATRLSQVVGTACVVLALLYYAVPQLELQRGYLVFGTVLIGTALVGSRRVFWACSHSPRLAERAVLLGQGQLAARLTAELERRPELGLRVAGAIDAPAADGGANALTELVLRERASRVIVALDRPGAPVPLSTLVELRSRGIRVEDGAETFEQATAKMALERLDLAALLALDRTDSRLRSVCARGLALLLSVSALILLWPLLALIALAIRCDSPGPVIFRQQRVGRGGRLFTLYKFRSMRISTDADGMVRPALPGDPRITRVGRWLRRCRLDELPQLVNVMRGDLALVGPRPFVLEQETALAAAIPFYSYRWTVTPGLTGWAQVQHGYCATVDDNAEKLAYDLFYIKHRSLGLDVFILFQTVKILLLGRGAR